MAHNNRKQFTLGTARKAVPLGYMDRIFANKIESADFHEYAYPRKRIPHEYT
jgi:hypothetical protein